MILIIPILTVPQSKITNDCTIIEKAKGLKVFFEKELQVLNRVRIRLQVIFVSDLISDSSLVVKESILSGRGSSRKCNNYNWPKSQPSKADQSI